MPAALPTLQPPHRGRPPTAGLRQIILRAAEVVFTRHDYHEVLMEDVARSCGIAKGTVYRYFPSKRQLYLAVMFEGIEQLRTDLETAVETADMPAHKIERVVRCILTHFWNRRFFFALIHRNEYKPDAPDVREWVRRRTEIARLVQRAIEEAMAADHLRQRDPRILAEMLLGMLRGVNRYRSRHDTLDDLVGVVVEVFLRGAAAPAGRHYIGNGRKRTCA